MSTWQKVHFMNELEHYGFIFDIFNPFMYNSWDEANEKLIRYVKNNRPAMFFTVMRSARLLYTSTIDAIKQLGVPTLFFVTDSLATPYEDKEVALHFDLVWITEPATRYLYNKWGVNTMLAPYAANPFAFKPFKVNYKDAVCFIGRAHGSRANMINSLAALSDIVIDVFDKGNDNDDENKRLAGNRLKGYMTPKYKMLYNWSRYSVGRKMLWSAFLKNTISKGKGLGEPSNVNHMQSLSFDEIPKIYSMYKLSVSSTSYHNTDVLNNPVNVINLRSFEIPMSGGLQFCRFNPYLAEQFEEDKEIIFYRTTEEMHSKADYYIHKSNNLEINALKEAARKRAEHEHTWMKRFEIAFKEFGIKY